MLRNLFLTRDGSERLSMLWLETNDLEDIALPVDDTILSDIISSSVSDIQNFMHKLQDLVLPRLISESEKSNMRGFEFIIFEVFGI